MRLKRLVGLAGVLAIVPAVAAAQVTPPAPPAPPARPAMPMVRRIAADSAFSLGAAYREIGRAEQIGASGHYLDAARTHYRSAIDRHNRNDDTGASAEARLASDLARVAMDERPANATSGPRDIPAPPTPHPITARPVDGSTAPRAAESAMDRAMRMVGPEFAARMPMLRVERSFGPRRGFDATALAEALRIETGAEARQLAQAAVDANSAAQRAALVGNVEEASRQSRTAGDLLAAVRDLAALNHPDMRRRMADLQVFGDLDSVIDIEGLDNLSVRP